ncbi:hypothetical protein QBC38DRAFT_454141 [Podospora fimiseda]|uniref:Uncharacterized protein n=1 Tax=Podospora fimiseda TaxID=252190 RepID=A0AAN7BSA8_9PEZI|nr:hypothetical protein QBC38DRAFT_454141 [Podospora fimiseda]
MSRSSPILKHTDWESIDIGHPPRERQIIYRHVKPFSINPRSTTDDEEEDDISSLFPLPPTYSQFHSTPYTPRRCPTTPSTSTLVNSPLHPPFQPSSTSITSYSTFPPIPTHDNLDAQSSEASEEEDCYSDHLDLDDYMDTPAPTVLKSDKPPLRISVTPHKSRYITNLFKSENEPLLPFHNKTNSWKGIGPGLKVLSTAEDQGNCFIKRRKGKEEDHGWQKITIRIFLGVLVLMALLVLLGNLGWNGFVAGEKGVVEGACSEARPKFCHLVLGT